MIVMVPSVPNGRPTVTNVPGTSSVSWGANLGPMDVSATRTSWPDDLDDLERALLGNIGLLTRRIPDATRNGAGARDRR